MGIFASGGDVHESEIWADAEVAMSAFRRTGYQSVTARLADGSRRGPRRVPGRRSAATRASRSACCASRSTTPSRPTCCPRLINVLGYTVAAFMAVGATFGALNCMYSAIASRQVEIATLRAIGFGGTPVVVSVMIEALVLPLLGGAVGGDARLRLLRRRVALDAQLQHLLPGGVRLPGHLRPAPAAASSGRSSSGPAGGLPARGARGPHPGHRGPAHALAAPRLTRYPPRASLDRSGRPTFPTSPGGRPPCTIS